MIETYEKKVFLESYGCSYNTASSEVILGLISKENFEIVSDIKDASLIILNTCIVKSQTESRITHRIKFLEKEYPNKKLIITGCMPEVYPEKIEQIAPKASMIGPHYVTSFVEIVKKIIEGNRITAIGKRSDPKLCLSRVRRNPVIGIIPIAQGCSSNCSYCIVKPVMGPLISFPKEMILKEVKRSLTEGCKEIWLTAQDTSSYGLDINDSLPSLLNEIVSFENEFKIRVGMMNPSVAFLFLEDLVESYKNPKIYKFLHLPVQSGNDRILKLMNRKYAPEQFEEIISRFRKSFPEISISTDIIVGFPGETEEEFKDSVQLIKKTKPDIVNISKFGPRQKTKAAKMKQLPSHIIKERSKRLAKICREISIKKNKQWIGKQHVILISEKGKKGGWKGRNFAYKPVIVKTNRNLLGKFVNVSIIDAKQTYLIGNLQNI